MQKHHRTSFALFLLLSILIFSGCSNPQGSQSTTITPAANETPLTEPTPQIISVWLPPYLPADLRSSVNFPGGTVLSSKEASADIRLDVSADDPVSRWVYSLAAPFSTVTDSITSSELIALWAGNPFESSSIDRILVDGNTKLIFEKFWGLASPDTVKIVSNDAMLEDSWNEHTTWALIPFEMLEPRWKVISVDGYSPIQKTFDTLHYPLSVPFSFVGNQQTVAFLKNDPKTQSMRLSIGTNRDARKMTVVALTGVTALVRGTAYLMETSGLTYPAMDIGSILRDADITHISNEIPFVTSCPKPFVDKVSENKLVFCSKPEYIQLLESVGTDVVELTGDHFRDWGAQAMLDTLDMYEQRGWKYYGGGKNVEDGWQPALFEHNGNKIAFIGCNGKAPGYATASDTSPGAVICDYERASKLVSNLRAQGYIPIFTFQHVEYYRYKPAPEIVEDFHVPAHAGAAIVSGSQAHQPQALEFYQGSFIHYGLGNLFFDQYFEGSAQRKAFIDQHIFYDGKHISTELVTIQFVDMARPRLMTIEEREYLLKDVFYASGWKF